MITILQAELRYGEGFDVVVIFDQQFRYVPDALHDVAVPWVRSFTVSSPLERYECVWVILSLCEALYGAKPQVQLLSVRGGYSTHSAVQTNVDVDALNLNATANNFLGQVL
jgi:hypothetical protein